METAFLAIVLLGAILARPAMAGGQFAAGTHGEHNRVLAPGNTAKDQTVQKDPKSQRSAAQVEQEAEKAARARLTASLREQRLKRDAELAAAGILAEPPRKRAARKKPA